MSPLWFILTSVGFSTTYGFNEMFCGDIGSPRSCSVGSITASGEGFDPDIPTGAVFSPSWLRMKSVVIPLRIEGGKCRFVRINDKGNNRYRFKRSFDLTPASVRLLGGKSTRHWSGTVTVCTNLLNKRLTREEIIKWNLSSEP